MLRTNTKKAKENIKNYIIENFDCSGYDIETPETYKDICKTIYDTFYSEKVKYDNRKMPIYEIFKEWCSGLPSILDTCYYYNRSAVEDLKNILEETEEEAKKFTEEQAEERLTYLLYREITNNK